ncbi:hypothetical protein ACHHV8_07300 [Paenibacillus sp. TAB 01]|uniref:hypothetical protein n=1 Tax=Paenibacillus sp. TAB 01 TaxID=3368988 RepID=UPI00374FF178
MKHIMDAIRSPCQPSTGKQPSVSLRSADVEIRSGCAAIGSRSGSQQLEKDTPPEDHTNSRFLDMLTGLSPELKPLYKDSQKIQN